MRNCQPGILIHDGSVDGARGFAVVVATSRPAAAWPPQTTMGSGFHNGGDSFFEKVGVGFGFSIPAPGGNINFTNVGGVATPLGLGNNAGGASFGSAVKTPLGTAFFGLSAAQGSADSSMVSQGGSLTVINGGTGFVSDTSQRPFVTSVIPVVGDNDAGPGDGVEIVSSPLSAFNANPSVLGERLGRLNSGDKGGPRGGAPRVAVPNLMGRASSLSTARGPAPAADPFQRKLAAAAGNSAGQPAASVSEIRAQLAAEDAAALAEWKDALDRAQQALDAGKPNVARNYYQQVIRHASGPLKQQAIDGLRAISASSSPPGAKP